MSEIKCPNCSGVLNVNGKSKNRVICQKCLQETGKTFIMIETKSNQDIQNLGDGFFTKS